MWMRWSIIESWAIFKQVDLSEVLGAFLYTQLHQSQGLDKASGVATLLVQLSYKKNGEERHGAGGTADCIWEFYSRIRFETL